jgi:hypothetical protein
MTNFPRQTEPSSGWPPLPEFIRPEQVTFVGEHTGPAEKKLTDVLRRFFAHRPTFFLRAHLARISFGEPSACSVVLCIRHADNIEENLHRGFKRMFSEVIRTGRSFDLMFLGEAQERELRKVCQPFYQAA